MSPYSPPPPQCHACSQELMHSIQAFHGAGGSQLLSLTTVSQRLRWQETEVAAREVSVVSKGTFKGGAVFLLYFVLFLFEIQCYSERNWQKDLSSAVSPPYWPQWPQWARMDQAKARTWSSVEFLVCMAEIQAVGPSPTASQTHEHGVGGSETGQLGLEPLFLWGASWCPNLLHHSASPVAGFFTNEARCLLRVCTFCEHSLWGEVLELS